MVTLTFTASGFLIGWLIWSGVVVVVRGLAGTTRTYGLIDAIFGAAEIAFLIWLVTEIGS